MMEKERVELGTGSTALDQCPPPRGTAQTVPIAPEHREQPASREHLNLHEGQHLLGRSGLGELPTGPMEHSLAFMRWAGRLSLKMPLPQGPKRCAVISKQANARLSGQSLWLSNCIGGAGSAILVRRG